jgi:hypothetical protein
MYLVFVLVAAALVGCYNTSEADREQAQETGRMTAEAHAQVGMPDIINWTELRQFKDILELRDESQLATYTYIVNWQGELLPLCQSIGYGLPYSVQFTNPEKHVWIRGNLGKLPQPDPNGLFMPTGLSATWVICIDPDTGEPDPVYVEPEIIVSRFELDFGDWTNPGQ